MRQANVQPHIHIRTNLIHDCMIILSSMSAYLEDQLKMRNPSYWKSIVFSSLKYIYIIQNVFNNSTERSSITYWAENRECFSYRVHLKKLWWANASPFVDDCVGKAWHHLLCYCSGVVEFLDNKLCFNRIEFLVFISEYYWFS